VKILHPVSLAKTSRDREELVYDWFLDSLRRLRFGKNKVVNSYLKVW
jgi:hypothetical protein